MFLLWLALGLQSMLIIECLLRRILMLFVPLSEKRSAVQKYGDANVLSHFFAVLLQVLTIPIQAFFTILGSLGYVLFVVMVFMVLFWIFMTVCNSNVYVVSMFARLYNTTVAPSVNALRWLLGLVDYFFRFGVAIWNGTVYIISELLLTFFADFSFKSVEHIPDIFENLSIMTISFIQSWVTWIDHVQHCTTGFEANRIRECAVTLRNNATVLDCAGVFMLDDTNCHATPNFLAVDMLTPGLYARLLFTSVQKMISEHCGLLALYANVITYPLTDYNLYLTIHSFSNTILHALIGLPITTIRRCEKLKAGLYTQTERVVGCTPDWQPLFEYSSTVIFSWGKLWDNWLNTLASIIYARITGTKPVCAAPVRINNVLLDAAGALRAMDVLESGAGEDTSDPLGEMERTGVLDELREAMEDETLDTHGPETRRAIDRLRFVGMTHNMLAVTNGDSVLFRSAHDGYVWAYGAWPVPMDVNFGFAAVTYTPSAGMDADATAETRTGILGCTCVDNANADKDGLALICGTAPYLQHARAEDGARPQLHDVIFESGATRGMTCGWTRISVQALRWPRRRTAVGYRGMNGVDTGDTEALDPLRIYSQTGPHAKASSDDVVEATIVVQPLCGRQDALGAATCSEHAINCFPYCMGLVMSNKRRQDIRMHSAYTWENNLVMPGRECVLTDDNGEPCSELDQTWIDDFKYYIKSYHEQNEWLAMREQTQLLRCSAVCSDAKETSSSMPLAAVAALGADGYFKGLKTEDAVHIVQQNANQSLAMRVLAHKKIHASVRLEQQPIVVAGDVMLFVDTEKVVVSRLFDVGRNGFEMQREQLTMLSNAHAIEIGTCAVQADYECVAAHARAGRITLPPSVSTISFGASEANPASHTSQVRPAAASQWAVHWAVDPDLALYSAFFRRCRNESMGTNFVIQSSITRPRVWTMRTMRTADLETTDGDSRNRVSYMLIPDFFEPTFVYDDGLDSRVCDTVVNLRVVNIEFLNEQNILVSVLAARPRDYDAERGDVDEHSPKTYRHYFLHPQRHNCYEPREGSGAHFTCWRPESDGMWKDDELVGSSVFPDICPEQSVIPPFGSLLVTPTLAFLQIGERVLTAITVLPAASVANNGRVHQLFFNGVTVSSQAKGYGTMLRQPTFHRVLDSGGSQILRVDDILALAHWTNRMAGHVLLTAWHTTLSVVGFESHEVARGTAVIVGTARIVERGPTLMRPFNSLHRIFRFPQRLTTEFGSTFVQQRASTSARLVSLGLSETSAGRIAAIPATIMALLQLQTSMVGTLHLILTVGRRIALSFLRVTPGKIPSSVLSAALMESHADVREQYLDSMRFQCHGFADIAGRTTVIGKFLLHGCLILPDTLDGTLDVVRVLLGEYPVLHCVCKLQQGHPIESMDTCLQHFLVMNERQWILGLQFPNQIPADATMRKLALSVMSREDACYAAMDGANLRLQNAFNPMFTRLYKATNELSLVLDAMLSSILGGKGPADNCEDYTSSPYVVAILPEPTDYFMGCMATADCAIRCADEYAAFEQAKEAAQAVMNVPVLGYSNKEEKNIRSMFFNSQSLNDVAFVPPFKIFDQLELRPAHVDVICGVDASANANSARNRAIVLAGHGIANVLQIAYYCLPIDIMSFVYEWSDLQHDVLNIESQGVRFDVSYANVGNATVIDVKLMSALFVKPPHVREKLLVVTHDLDGADKVWIMIPGLPARLILRTATTAEQDLTLKAMRAAGTYVSTAEKDAGFLNMLDNVEVEPTLDELQPATVYVYGWTLEIVQDKITEKFVCLRTMLNLNVFSGLNAQWRDCNADDSGKDVQRVCIHNAAQIASFACDIRLNLPIVSTATAFVEYWSPNQYFRKELATTSSLQVLQVNNLDLVRDRNGMLRMRETMAPSVMWLDDEEWQHLRLFIEGVQIENPTPINMEMVVLFAYDVSRNVRTWIHSLEIDLTTAAEIVTSMHDGLRTRALVALDVECSVLNCEACEFVNIGTELERTKQLGLQTVQTLCYNAQQCAVARCVGTVVNIRKPLCQLGALMSEQLHIGRILLQTLWDGVATTTIAMVELSHLRARPYELAWPEEGIQATMCQTKDAIVQVSAMIPSFLGVASWAVQDVSNYVPGMASADSRVHARFEMIMMSLTNVLSSILMGPIYLFVAVQQFIGCSANSVQAMIQNLITGSRSSGSLSPTMQVYIGSRAIQQRVHDAGIHTCLSDHDLQDMREATVATQVADRLAQVLSDLSSNVITFAVLKYVRWQFIVFEIVISWFIGIFSALTDLAQTSDWKNCKLAVVIDADNQASVCVCGDQPHSIIRPLKSHTVNDGALWCSGFLWLNGGDGSDQLVWNPYSLEELLVYRENDKRSVGRFANCMGGSMEEATAEAAPGDSRTYVRANKCAKYKPRPPEFREQGVDIMQIITRCRANYQQAKWDEAAALYSLFSTSDLLTMQLYHSASMQKNDRFKDLRNRMAELALRYADNAKLSLTSQTWLCLYDAIHHDLGLTQHACHRHENLYKGANAFQYEVAQVSTSTSPAEEFRATDACKVFSGVATSSEDQSSLSLPPFLWTGSSSNYAAVARMHSISMDKASRIANAKQELLDLIQNEIRPAFVEIERGDLVHELMQHLDVVAVTEDGDLLHQFMDCLVMGPFASASLTLDGLHGLGFELNDANEHFNAPEYHRGSSTSRAFSSYSNTGGSEARRRVMRSAWRIVENEAEEIVAQEAAKQIEKLETMWLEVDATGLPVHLMCMCPDYSTSIDCCVDNVEQGLWHKNTDIVFEADSAYERDTWDIHTNIASNMLQRLSVANIEALLWTDESFVAHDKHPLTPADRESLAAAYIFDTEKPVLTYTSQDTKQFIGNQTLWEQCTAEVGHMFALLPLQNEEQLAANSMPRESRHVRLSTIDSNSIDYDPTVFTASTYHDNETHAHALERVIAQVLTEAQRFSPFYWTHVHRYVPSNSVWCERTWNKPDALLKARTSSVLEMPSTLRNETLRTAQIPAFDLQHTVFPANVLDVCLCGTDLPCVLPEEACADSDILLALPAFQSLCLQQTYSTRSELLVILEALNMATEDSALAQWHAGCWTVDGNWGLLSSQQHADWFSGKSAESVDNWKLDAQELATYGANSLRVGELTENGGGLQERLRQTLSTAKFKTSPAQLGINTQAKHTIGQPICMDNLAEVLTEDLQAHFTDVFFPMSHSVLAHIGHSTCARWVLETALLTVMQEGLALGVVESILVVTQTDVVALWQMRCETHVKRAGQCHLRGVYNLFPPSALSSPSTCTWGTNDVIVMGCATHYFTPTCLLYCDGMFYDPCQCPAGCASEFVNFDKATCPMFFDPDAWSVTSTYSLTWPSVDDAQTILEAGSNLINTDLSRVTRTDRLHVFDLKHVFDETAQTILARTDSEGLNTLDNEFCDDQLDYWPDQQHPVGYHPTPACRHENTHWRGFESWMSTGDDARVNIDPVRMRNMTRFSQAVGFGFVVCDAQAWGVSAVNLNPYVISTRWDPTATADPTLPRKPSLSILETMSQYGAPSTDPADTPLYTIPGTRFTLQHSLGLIRDWARWYEPHDSLESTPRSAHQLLLDLAWPHWPVESVRARYMAASLQPLPGCQFPSLRQCTIDSECADAWGVQLQCLLNHNPDNANGNSGICAKVGSCFQHLHCDPGQMCDGTGTCVTPQFALHNNALEDVSMQLFTKAGNVDNRGVSRFDNVHDFAMSNGMCSLRNWYHYLNHTAKGVRDNNLRVVSDFVVSRTDTTADELLSQRGVLVPRPHPCDRDFEHVAHFKLYIPENTSSVRYRNTFLQAHATTSTRFWDYENENDPKVRFCDAGSIATPANSITGFLNPYVDSLAQEPSLLRVPSTIRRCIEFELCPVLRFHVGIYPAKSTLDAQPFVTTVEDRRVRIASRQSTQIRIWQQSTTRHYCLYDSSKCFAMGYLLGESCIEAEQVEETHCVLDPLVVPLVSAVFGPLQSELDVTRLYALRQHCPHAFTNVYDSLKNEELFALLHQLLTKPYSHDDVRARDRIAKHVNALTGLLFGVTDIDNTRGFQDIDTYLQHSDCTQHIADMLDAQKDAQLQQGLVYVDENDSSMQLGSSIYFVIRNVMQWVPLRWIVQCIVLATHSEGGVIENWMQALTSSNMLTCQNHKESIEFPEGTGFKLTMKKRLISSPILYTRTKNRNPDSLQLLEDVDALITHALAELSASALPDLYCIGSNDISVHEHFAQDPALPITASYLQRTHFPGVNFLEQNTLDMQNSIYHSIRQHLLGDVDYESQEWMQMSVSDLESKGILVRRSEDLQHEVVLNTNIFPLLEFTALKFLDANALLHADNTNYVTTEPNQCDATQMTLTMPEHSLSIPYSCDGLQMNAWCAELQGRKFLRPHELKFLILLYMQREMSNTLSINSENIHSAWSVQTLQYYTPALCSKGFECEMDLISTHEYNVFMDNKQYECSAASADFKPHRQTNSMHARLRACVDQLQQQSGFVLQRGETITMPVHANVYTSGFYPSFVSYNDVEDGENKYLYMLTSERHWKNNSISDAICFSDSIQDVEIINPFWAEHFDIETGCDISRSATGELFIDTFCRLRISTNQDRDHCSAHPQYANIIQNLMSSQCSERDSEVVYRRKTGAVRDGDVPLCDVMPDDVSACSKAHKTLHNYAGRVPTRDEMKQNNVQAAQAQAGMWNQNNFLFSANTQHSREEEASPLPMQVLPTDIGGQSLEFAIDGTGWLSLRCARLQNAIYTEPHLPCRDVSSWLQNAHSDFAWEHKVQSSHWREASNMQTSWRCPLQWFDTYADEAPVSSLKARVPSRERNAVRFSHITKPYYYAHPTVNTFTRIRNLEAPKFISDGIMCVLNDTRCHSENLLDSALQQILSRQNAWHIVTQYPALDPEEECSRILDWPHEEYGLRDN